MQKHHNGYDSHHNCNIVSGNSLDLDVNYCECEIRADVVVSEYNSIRLWGRIINSDGRPVPNALVKLLKMESIGKKVNYIGVAHTVSDCEGFYQFELTNCSYDKDASYKVLANKAAYGPERVIPTSSNNCKSQKYCSSPEPCEPFESYEHYHYNSCKEYPPIGNQDIPSYNSSSEKINCNYDYDYESKICKSSLKTRF